MTKRLTFKNDGIGGSSVYLDGVNIGHISRGPYRWLELFRDGNRISIARFKHGKNRLQQAKSFCKIVLTSMPVDDVITILHDKRSIAPLTLQYEIEAGKIPTV